MTSFDFSIRNFSGITLAIAAGLLAFTSCERAPESGEEATESVTSSPETSVTTLPGSGNSLPNSGSGATSSNDSSSASDPRMQLVIEAVAEVLGTAPSSVALDEPIIQPEKGIEEFELLDILLGLEDRFDVEINEDAIEQVTGGRFDDVQKQLTPRQLLGIVAKATSQ